MPGCQRNAASPGSGATRIRASQRFEKVDGVGRATGPGRRQAPVKRPPSLATRQERQAEHDEALGEAIHTARSAGASWRDVADLLTACPNSK